MTPLLSALIAAQGAYVGPVKSVLAPIPVVLDEEPVAGPIETPEEEAPYWFEIEQPIAPNPNWVYQEDPGGGSPQTIITNFQGLTATGWFPPDVQIAAGPTYIGEAVNSNLRFYTKAGATVYSQSFLTFFSPLSPPTNYIFDPKIAYDPEGGRWLVIALYLNTGAGLSSYYLAVSQTGDPLGSWYYYDLDATIDGVTPSGNWADYPGLGFNSWGLFITSNQYSFAFFSYQYAKLRVIDKSSAYSGTLSGWFDFYNISNTFSWKPAQSVDPVPTEFVAMSFSGSANFVSAWGVAGPAASPTLSSRYNIPVGAYQFPPEADQLGGGQVINTGDARTQDVTYGRTYTGQVYIYFTFSERNPAATSYAASRYIRIDTATMSADEDITFGGAGAHYYYPRVAPGDSCIAMVMSRSSTSEYAGAWYTWKASYDPSFQPSALIKAGEGYYDVVFGGRNRWGDYLGAYPDPSTGRVWAAGQYSLSSNNWATWLADVDCGGPVGVGSEEAGRKGDDIVLPDGLVFLGAAAFELSGAERFGLFDATGRRVTSLAPGFHSLSLAPGVYFIRTGERVGRFIVVK